MTIITAALLVGVVYAAWPEIVKAWGLLDKVNLWVLSLMIPVQIFSYYAISGIIFSYLKSKGSASGVSLWKKTRIALELNFVNHIIPSGGAAGFSYLAWVLRKYRVSVARSTMAQIIRFTLTFVSFVMLLIISMIVLALSHHINRNVVLIGLALTVLVVVGMALIIWLMQNRARLDRFSKWLEKTVNKLVRFFTRGRLKRGVKTKALVEFFDEIHDDYVAIRKERKLLIKPYIWAVVANLSDAALLWIAFWSLGFYIEPALLFIAFGLSSVLSAISVTPGGAGIYEAAMIMFLTTAGISPDVAIAGTLIARVVLVMGTIVFGYVFYQTTIVERDEKDARNAR